MDNTPPVTETGIMETLVFTRNVGAHVRDLSAAVNVPARVVPHTLEPFVAVTSAFLRVDLASLEAFVVPTLAGVELGFELHLGWGHVEHAFPTDFNEMVQLPAFTSVLQSSSEAFDHAAASLRCPLLSPISKMIKPCPDVGGRPALFVMFTPGAEAPANTVLARIVVRAALRCGGADIIIV